MNPTIIIEGFGIGAGLIIAIGSQNAFVLKKGIMKQHVFTTALTCSIIDTLLIILGSMGLGTIISRTPIMVVVFVKQFMKKLRVCLIFCVNLQISVNYNYINLEVFL